MAELIDVGLVQSLGQYRHRRGWATDGQPTHTGEGIDSFYGPVSVQSPENRLRIIVVEEEREREQHFSHAPMSPAATRGTAQKTSWAQKSFSPRFKFKK